MDRLAVESKGLDETQALGGPYTPGLQFSLQVPSEVTDINAPYSGLEMWRVEGVLKGLRKQWSVVQRKFQDPYRVAVKVTTGDDEVTVIRDNRMYLNCDRVLGKGTSKVVRLFFDLIYFRDVAIVDPDETTPTDMLLREWRFIRLGNGVPFFPITYGLFPGNRYEDGDAFGFVQECCEFDLSHYLDSLEKKKSPFPENEKDVAFSHIIRAVAWFHERGFAVRDIKPGNILISYDGKYKLTDWGHAAACNDKEVNSHVGTPYYQSPEYSTTRRAAVGQTIDIPFYQRGDMWALGVTLYDIETCGTSSARIITVWETERSVINLATPATPEHTFYQIALKQHLHVSHPIRGAIISGCLEPDQYKRLTMSQVLRLLEQLEASAKAAPVSAGPCGPSPFALTSPIAISREEVKESKRSEEAVIDLRGPFAPEASFTLEALAPMEQFRSVAAMPQDVLRTIVGECSALLRSFRESFDKDKSCVLLKHRIDKYRIYAIRNNQVYLDCNRQLRENAAKVAHLMLDLVHGQEVAVLDPVLPVALDARQKRLENWQNEWAMAAAQGSCQAFPKTIGILPQHPIDTPQNRQEVCIIQEHCPGHLGERYVATVKGIPILGIEKNQAFTNLAKAMHWLHSRGLAHGHITRDHIVIDRDGNYKLLNTRPLMSADAGDSPVIDNSLAYWAPESWERNKPLFNSGQRVKPVDIGFHQRCDMWALGITLMLLEMQRSPHFFKQIDPANPSKAWEEGAAIRDLVQRGAMNYPIAHPIRGAIINGCLHAHPEKRLTSSQMLDLITRLAGAESPVPETPSVSAAASRSSGALSSDGSW